MSAAQQQTSGQRSAFDQARATCDQYGVCDFAKEVVEHFREGYIFALPNLFLMAKAVELPMPDGRKAWLVTHAIGELRSLAGLMPFPLPWIALRRRFDRRLRLYRTERFLQHAKKL